MSNLFQMKAKLFENPFTPNFSFLHPKWTCVVWSMPCDLGITVACAVLTERLSKQEIITTLIGYVKLKEIVVLAVVTMYCTAACGGGEVFLSGQPSLSGFSWTEARDSCSMQGAVLPLGSISFDSCYHTMFRQVSRAVSRVWTDSCNANADKCRVHNVNLGIGIAGPSFGEAIVDITTASYFPNIVCRRGMVS